MATNSSIPSTKPGYQVVIELLPIALSIVAINTLVFFLFAKEKRLRTPTNYLLLSLALCDFLNGLINIPLFIVVFLKVIDPPAGVRFGFFVVVLHNLVIILMVYHILAITLERYFSIARPFQHRSVTKKTTLKIMTAIWLTSVTIALLPFTWFWRFSSLEYKTLAFKFQTGYIIFCLVFVFFVPYAVIIYSQVVIFRSIRKSSSESFMEDRRESAVHNQIQNDKRCLIIFTAMAFIDGVCWLPWYILSLIFSFWFPLGENTDLALQDISHAFLIIRYLTSIANPVLYTFFKQDFLRAFKVIILRQKFKNNIRQKNSHGKTSLALLPRKKLGEPGCSHRFSDATMEENLQYLTGM